MSEDATKKTTKDEMQSPQVGEVKEETPVETTDNTIETAAETVVEETPADKAIESTETAEGDAEVAETQEETTPVKTIPEFRAGDTVKVYYRIVEGTKTRTQPYEGIVIARKGKEQSKTFTVRRIGADNVGVERIFPLFSPNIEKIEVLKRGKVRRSKLYYLRDKKGREAMRIRELGK